jgi:hypothetical protein
MKPIHYLAPADFELLGQLKEEWKDVLYLPEDGGDVLLRNVGKILEHDAASQLIIPLQIMLYLSAHMLQMY